MQKGFFLQYLSCHLLQRWGY